MAVSIRRSTARRHVGRRWYACTVSHLVAGHDSWQSRICSPCQQLGCGRHRRSASQGSDEAWRLRWSEPGSLREGRTQDSAPCIAHVALVCAERDSSRQLELLRGGEREYLYDLGNDLSEKKNLASTHPEIAARLRAELTAWASELQPPGLALEPMAKAWNEYYDFYLDGKPAPPQAIEDPSASKIKALHGWQAEVVNCSKRRTASSSSRMEMGKASSRSRA